MEVFSLNTLKPLKALSLKISLKILLLYLNIFKDIDTFGISVNT